MSPFDVVIPSKNAMVNMANLFKFIFSSQFLFIFQITDQKLQLYAFVNFPKVILSNFCRNIYLL